MLYYPLSIFLVGSMSADLILPTTSSSSSDSHGAN